MTDASSKKRPPIFAWMAHFLLPALMALFPIVFHYGNNAEILSPVEIAKQIPLFFALTVGLYVFFTVLTGRRTPGSANAAFIFLLFFNTYGFLYDAMRGWDALRVEHYTFLPAYCLLGCLVARMIGRMEEPDARNLWNGATFVLGVLVAFNLVRVIPAEMKKAEIRNREWVDNSMVPSASDKSYPDIYYIVFDEMVGFEAMRTYWQYEAIDEFVGFFTQNGFYVAESSYAETIQTFHELATRLNYQTFPYSETDPNSYWGEYLPAMSNNRSMQFLKSLGYTTIVFDEYPIGFMPFNADIVYNDPETDIMTWDSIFNDFGILIMEHTMLQPFLGMVRVKDAQTMVHARRIFFTEQNLTQPNGPSPKFVYIHLLIPHVPFMFDRNGNFIDVEDQNDWDKYLGTYMYAIRIAENMISSILSSHDGSDGTVIIFQSDHGARNLENVSDAVLLENYPQQYSLLIVNAIRIPGCDTSVLTQDMNPINTFPIIFNCYFNANIPLQ
jgi:hypothetical protein